jgi:small subunit ribosomal protein S6
MRDYEIVYIFKSGFMPEEIEQRLEKYHDVLTSDGGEITAVEQWGKRQLAYPIRKESNGYYVIAQFTVEPVALPEFERRLKLDEDLLRHLIVISEGELPRPAASLEHGEPSAAATPVAEKAVDEASESAPAEATEDEAGAEEGSEEEASEVEAADEEEAEEDAAEDEAADEEAPAEPVTEEAAEAAPADDEAEVEPAGDEAGVEPAGDEEKGS